MTGLYNRDGVCLLNVTNWFLVQKDHVSLSSPLIKLAYAKVLIRRFLLHFGHRRNTQIKVRNLYVYWTVHHLDSWIKIDLLMSLAVLFHYLPLNMFRMLVHPSSGAYDLLWIYFMWCIVLVRCVLVLRCGSVWVVWYPDASWSNASACIRIFNVLMFKHNM